MRMPGGDWRRLYSARSTSDATRHQLGVEAGVDDLADGAVVDDERLEERVEHVVGGKALVVALVGTQLGRGRLHQHRLGDDGAARHAISVPAQPVHERLGHVLDHGEAACRVAVERRVAGGELALVAGGEHDPPRGVGHGHEDHAADARLEVLVGEALGLGAEHGGQEPGEGTVRLLDGDGVQVDAEGLGQRGGVAARSGARVARRHGQAVDVVGTERVDGHSGDERGVDAPRQPHHGV